MFPSHPTTGSARTMGRDQYDHFVGTRSRVIRIFNLPSEPSGVLANAFGHASAHRPVSFWTLRDGDEHSAWAVFATHDEAAAALSLSGANLSIATALDSDLLNNLDKLKRIHIRSSPPMDDLYAYTLSSNPPNPRSTSNAFRQGDWLCPRPFCAVHNFSRNLACISCGGPRPAALASPATPNFPVQWSSPVSAMSPQLQQSPRFAANVPAAPPVAHKNANGQSLLTPSGRSFSVGGKVQNVSNDPLAPCIIFWPDNEPFPEQGQIRPPMTGAVQPPILNTGNKGPIEHQPGDWICSRCEYHNWRRRKVCQTCFPFAEGNSDNVTTAAQQDRINLLASLLAQQHASAQTQNVVNGVQFTSPFVQPSASPYAQFQGTPTQVVPPPPPPYQLPIALPEASPKSFAGLGIGGGLGSGIPTPPNEHLDLGFGEFADFGLGRPSAAAQASRLTRFASQPSLRAQMQAGGGWPPANPNAHLSNSSASSPRSASFLHTSHPLPLPHRPPPLTVSPGLGLGSGSWSAGPASAKSDTFSFASSSSDFELPPLPAPSFASRRFGSVAVVSGSALGRDVACAPRHTGSLDLDAFRLGLKLHDEEGIEELEDEEHDSELSLSRPGTGTSHSHSRSSADSSPHVPQQTQRAIGSLPEVQSLWTAPRGADGRAVSIAAPSIWTAGEAAMRARPNLKLAPIGSGRAVGQQGSSPPTSAGAQSGYVLLNIGK